MQRYIIRRVLEMIPTTLGILLLTFLLFHVVGGSPAQVVLGKNATPESLEAFDAKYGYDKPIFLGHWAKTRALEDQICKAPPGMQASSGFWQIPLAFALPQGVYRLRISDTSGASDVHSGCIQILMQSIDGGLAQTNEVPLSDSAGRVREALCRIPSGRQLVALRINVDGQVGVRLRRKTDCLLDSQLIHFLSALARGDLGESAEYGMPVWRVLKNGIGPSLAITVPILVGGTLLAVMLGLMCAMWRGGLADRTILLASTLLMSVNYVVWVLAGQYFLAFKLRLFPIWGFEDWTFVMLPVLIGIVGGLGRDIRFFRTVILDEIYKPYVRTAWAKGLSPRQVMMGHVLRNSMIPIVTYVSQSIPFLFTGSLLLESFYGIPGLGCVSLNAVHSSDMAVVRAVVIVGALLYQGVNLLTDVCYAWLDPRVRLD